MERKKFITVLNDMLRENDLGGIVRESPEITKLAKPVREQIFLALKIYDFHMHRFYPDYTHDFGCFFVDGNFVHWKIDYYHKYIDASYGPDFDIADPSITNRVLSIMMAVEYYKDYRLPDSTSYYQNPATFQPE